MADEIAVKDSDAAAGWHEDDIPVRGCEFDLQQIKRVYRELDQITGREGDRLVAAFTKPDNITDDEFNAKKVAIRNSAFKITVSIVGVDRQTAWGDTEAIFDSKNLPLPIRSIFFTNTSAFRPQANGNLPRNRFSVWLHFDKPPVFDPNPLVSAPTENASKVEIYAEDVSYIRAVQTVINGKLKKNRKWYSFIHNKFIYDIGLWFVTLPYALFMVAKGVDKYLPLNGPYAGYRWAVIAYGAGVSLILYRCLTGYLKWAFPVNVLKENNDTATRHRVIFAGIVVGLIGTAFRALPGVLWPW